ncbi:ABC transporter substrate-binding protein [Psychromarinibacter sp. C21-152]|uniref:ABC transporter substrate-binding protein n=1 Tax=Psychromarinibacter sediminicola TaxID=3033385 RepID=A0AAE3TCI4_9RHOB|nr:ABC transporter substrate-binding protein [Psychromarinibacter sediminicola]MDF0603685.1 ABC transporter substrate-binding protein [Psychromarinibacter sediminicola]
MFHRTILPAAAAALTLTGGALAQTSVDFALDWKFEGPAAPYFVAIDEGYFAEEGLEVEITAGSGSLDAIPKVATGAFPVGFADINSLIRFLDQNPDAPVTAVMMIYDAPPFSIVGRKSLGVEKPADLEGSVLGAPPPDGAWAQFPIFAAENELDMDKITVEPVGFPTREPMLAEGNVDAVTGYNFSSYLNTARLGVPEDDISVIMMSDHGVDLYGNAVIVNTEYAAENPEVIEGFLRAVAKGWKAAIADPAGAIPSLMERNPAADADLETRRLELAIEGNVMTDWVKENGLGGIDPARLDSAVQQIGTVYEFQNAPDPAAYFTDEYLPDEPFMME